MSPSSADPRPRRRRRDVVRNRARILEAAGELTDRTRRAISLTDAGAIMVSGTVVVAVYSV